MLSKKSSLNDIFLSPNSILSKSISFILFVKSVLIFSNEFKFEDIFSKPSIPFVKDVYFSKINAFNLLIFLFIQSFL